MASGQFEFDAFLCHSSKDKAVVRPIANRLRADGLHVWFDEWIIRPGDSIPAKIEEGLEHSRVLVLCMSVNAFGSDWAQLEAGTFRFRDPLNKDRRFIPLRLDETPIKGSLAQFRYINWLPEKSKQEYTELLEGCRPSEARPVTVALPDQNCTPSPTQLVAEPSQSAADYIRWRRNAIEDVFSKFEPIHAFFFGVCIDYTQLVGLLHAGLAATDSDRTKFYGYADEIGKRLHEMHALEGRLRVAGAESAVWLMQNYRLQATEVNDMLQLQRPKMSRSDVDAVSEELFRRKDQLYQELAKALKDDGREMNNYLRL